MKLPQISQALDAGTFAGVTTHNGIHYAVVLLPGKVTDLTWDAAVQWAAEQGGMLPTRTVAAMLFANLNTLLCANWHWTSDEHLTAYAWSCYFGNGHQYYSHKSVEGSAVAVRLIPIVPQLQQPLLSHQETT